MGEPEVGGHPFNAYAGQSGYPIPEEFLRENGRRTGQRNVEKDEPDQFVACRQAVWVARESDYKRTS